MKSNEQGSNKDQSKQSQKNPKDDQSKQKPGKARQTLITKFDGGFMTDRPDYVDPLPDDETLPDDDIPDTPDVNDPLVEDDPDITRRPL